MKTNPVGRPTKYNEELLAKAEEYINTWQDIGEAIPTIAGLACFLDIDKKSIERWEKDDDKQEFSRICARARAEQEKALIINGLNRTFDASLSKLLLMKHGYSDRQEVDHTSGGERITELKITAV